MPQQMTITSFADVLNYIYDVHKTEKQKGDLFELVCRYYLRSDPQMSQVMGEVWLWKDAPTRNGIDKGIDIVAEDPENPGKYWAVQCKCHDPNKTLALEECSTFWGTAGPNPIYSRYVIMATTEHFSKNLETQIETTGTIRITPSDMGAANVDWEGVLTRSKSMDRQTFDLREHQEKAVKNINEYLDDKGYDRCKAIMACGTGKTLMSLRLSEGRNPNGLVLFAAPSIALVSQAMREWTNQARVDLRTLVVCSDAKASSTKDEDSILDVIADLAYPATTDPARLVERYAAIRSENPDAMVAVFSTYQSMQVIQDAQVAGLPEFDLIICDEAHRTTGFQDAGTTKEEVSAFLIVHDQERVHGKKRVYMTATPRIYGDQVKETARQKDYLLTSMDNEEIYGPKAHEITFSEAVEADLLCDYRVVVLAVREEELPRDLRLAIPDASDGSELAMDEAAKIIGCYKGLATHGEVSQQKIDAMFEKDSSELPDFFLIDTLEDDIPETESEIVPLHRAVGFCRSIKDSKNLNKMFGDIVEQYNRNAREDERYDLYCDLKHVDGGMDSKERHVKLDWLASGEDDEECRILTNARCLAEGVDVPSLDAVIFFSPRKSEVDVVQAVGRVMRSFTNKKTGEKKKLGYIILPVFIPSGTTPEEALNSSKTFDVVWKVLQALRSHDERIEAYVNSLQFRKKKEGKTAGIGKPGREPSYDETGDREQLQIDFSERLAEAIYTKAVDRVGTRIYWDSWAEDVAHIAERHIEQINDAIATDPVARKGFDSFIKGLRDSLNPGISEGDAIEMVAQHMITLPVFDALFGDFEFAQSNPVSIAITEFLKSLDGHGVGDMSDADEASLDALYSSVARRAKMARTDNGRQALIKNLYEEFFRKAFKGKTDKYGIVYTPDEIIDYILHATDRVLRREFGKSLADEGVHILDPFAGTGSFTARLIEDKSLIPDDKLLQKYANELHSNEILLLAYYVMVVNIEYAYHARTGEYREFPGALLTDTFQMTEKQNQIDELFFVDNSLRQLEQASTPVKILTGNPPYSAKQKNANDDNANEHYPTLENRVKETYSARSNATNKNSLLDSYVEAFRWASDRIGDEGIVCFVSSSGWLRSEAGEGIRRCFKDEFNDIYVFDLRGDAYTKGETRKREGDGVFGVGSRTPIAITMLVKNPCSSTEGEIHYYDVGDYKTREEKLKALIDYMNHDPQWIALKQDRKGDWLNQRDESFYDLAPMAVSDGNKKTSLGVYQIWSNGIKTQRDPWCWNYSRAQLIKNVSNLVNGTNEEIKRIQKDGDSLVYDAKKYSWTSAMEGYAKKGKIIPFYNTNIVLGLYRPFIKQWLYYERHLNERIYRQNFLFPIIDDGVIAENIVIQVPSKSKEEYCCYISNIIPDLNGLSGGAQCFPLYYYEPIDDARLFDSDGVKVVKDAWGNRYARRDAITDTALAVFQCAYPNAYMARAKKYGGAGINKEDIFYYVYGVLHSPEYRERFASNLAKELPRIPLVEDFEAFAEAGRKLADLHLHYEDLASYPTVQTGLLPNVDPGRVEKMRWAKKKDPETGKRVNDYTTLIFNRSITITGIPESAQSYVVNGRSPLDWMIDRYQVKTDKKSGITNDPNLYSDDPCYIVNLVGKLVRVAMETNNIVSLLPPIKEIEHPANWPEAWNVQL